MSRTAPAQQENVSQQSPWPALGALVIGFFMILVDSTIVSVGMPALMRAFDADINAVMWVTSAYLLAYAVPLLITGRLGDRIGPKRVYLVGLTIFTLASLWCGLSGELGGGIGWLVAARVAQGLGASLMTPQTMTVITRTFPPERRGTAMALWGATAGVATLVGPILGGVLLDTLGWEWMFFINVPVGIVGLYLAWRLVPTLQTHARSFDWVGVALSAAGLFCAVFAIQEGHAYGWGRIWGPVSVPLLLAIGAVLLVVFVWWQSRIRREPLVPLDLFRDRNFSVSNIAITTVGFGITAMMFPFMIYAQAVRDLSPTQAALLLAPQAVMSILLAPIAGRLTDRVHPRILAGSGLAGFAVTTFLLTRVMTADSPMWWILGVATLLGATQSFVWGPIAASATRNLPMQLAGAGSGVYNTTRQMGAVLGSAAIAMLMEARITALLPGVGSSSATVQATGGAGMPEPVRALFAEALSDAMLLPAVMVLLGFLAALFFERPRHQVKRAADAPRSASSAADASIGADPGAGPGRGPQS